MSDESDKSKRLRERTVAIAKELEEHLASRKVLSLNSREPWLDPPVDNSGAPPEVATLVVDEDVISVLEGALKEARAGHILGLILLMGRPHPNEKDLVTDIVTNLTFCAAENIQIFLGGLETARRDLFDFHDDIAIEEDDDADD